MVKFLEELIDFILSKANISIIIAVGVLLFFLVFYKLITKIILGIILKFALRASDDFKQRIRNSLERPIRIFILFLGLYIALNIFPYTFNIINKNILIKIYITINICIFMWMGYNLCSINSFLIEKIEKVFNFTLDKGVIALLSRILKALVFIVGITLILQTWNYDISVVVTSLGVFSAVIALAAKDYLTNVFSGLIIVADKPFSIGDYIETAHGIGIVEDISFRTTKIRTFEKALVTVPNSKLASDSVTNYSRRDTRRSTFNVGISYKTPIDKVKIVVNRIREMLYKNEEVENESIICQFDTFGESSLNIFLNFYIERSEWVEYLKVKEEINLDIMRILEEEEVEIAFPSQTIYFDKEE